MGWLLAVTPPGGPGGSGPTSLPASVPEAADSSPASAVDAACLAAHPARPGVAFAGRSDGQVWATSDGGRAWSAFGRLPHPIFSLAVSPWDGTLFAGCEPSSLWRWPGGSGGAVRCAGLEALPSRPTWSFPPRPWTSHVRWIAPAPDGPAVLCGIELGGIVRSPDGGETWEDQRPGAEPDCHCLAWVPGSRRVWEAAGGGTAFSLDGGAGWIRCPEGLDRRYAWGLCTDPGDPEVAFVSASPGAGHAHHRPGQAAAALFRRRGDDPWQRLGGGLPSTFDHLPVALGGERGVPGRVVAWLRNGEAWRTADGGERWHRMAGGLATGGEVMAAAWVA